MNSQSLVYALMIVVVMVLSSAVHEWAHAFVATKLGDDLPTRQGRVTLNPVAHIDPIGTLVVPAFAAFLGGMLVGWAKPVEFRPSSFRKDVTMRRGIAMVALAGPISNLALVVICAGLLKIMALALGGAAGVHENATMAALGAFLCAALFVNVVLFLFNLMPVPPLDGFRILDALSPADSKIVSWMEENRMIVFMVAIVVVFRLGYVPILWILGSTLKAFSITDVYSALQFR